jgi:DNA end-binding protein Ku
MATRPSWRGYMRLSLVSCPVRLYPAVNPKEHVSFHLVNPKTNNRVRMRPTDAETGAEVPRAALAYGYEVEKGRQVIVTKTELAHLKIESSQTLEFEHFVQERAIDPIYFSTPYYLVPDGKIATETYRVIHQAMSSTKMAGVGRLALAMREHVVLVSCHDRGMLLTTLRPAQELRDADELFKDLEGPPPDQELVQLAERIIRQKAVRNLDLKRFAKDRYQAALRELVERKAKGGRPKLLRIGPRPSNVIDLKDALKRSLEVSQSRGAVADGKRRSGSHHGVGASEDTRAVEKPNHGRRRRASPSAEP